MAYFNGNGYYGNYGNFPVDYPQYNPAPMRTPQPVQQQAPQSQGGGILWCQGEAGAKSYPVAPGGSVLLMDSEGSRFYIKSTDPSGMPNPLRTFVFQEVTAQSAPAVSPVQQAAQAAPDLSAYVTRDELNRRFAELLTPAQTPASGGADNGQSVT